MEIFLEVDQNRAAVVAAGLTPRQKTVKESQEK
jgi:hypothetical protein